MNPWKDSIEIAGKKFNLSRARSYEAVWTDDTGFSIRFVAGSEDSEWDLNPRSCDEDFRVSKKTFEEALENLRKNLIARHAEIIFLMRKLEGTGE